MALSKKAQKKIEADLAKEAEKVEDSKIQEQFRQIITDVAVNLSKAVESRLDQFKDEVYPFMLAELPTNPMAVSAALDQNCSSIREITNQLYERISKIGSPGIKVLFVDALQDSLSACKEASIESDVKVGRLAKILEV